MRGVRRHRFDFLVLQRHLVCAAVGADDDHYDGIDDQHDGYDDYGHDHDRHAAGSLSAACRVVL